MPDDRALIQRLVEIEAVKQGLDPQYVAAVARQESGFDPGARSPAGAMGVMQLMPTTARDLGVDPTDLQGNIHGGVRYLRQQLERFGDPALALAAYNAGPGAVQKYGGVPPFKETRRYVQKILGALTPARAEAAEPFARPGALRSEDRQAMEERLRQIQAVRAVTPAAADPALSETAPAPRGVFQGTAQEQIDTQVQMLAEQERGRLESERTATFKDLVPLARPIAAIGTSMLGTTAGAGTGAALGFAAGGPPGAALGGLIGGMAGSYIARRSNVETGLEDPGRFGDVASIVAPALPGVMQAGRQVVGGVVRASRAGRVLSAADEATAAAQAAYTTEQEAAEQAYRTGQQDYQATVRARETERVARLQRREAQARAEAEALTQSQAAEYAEQLRLYESQATRHRQAVTEARGIPAQYKPETPAHVLYDRVTQVAPEAPILLTRTQEMAADIAQTVQQMPTLMPPRMHAIVGDLERGNTTQSLKEVRKYLSELGSMTRSPILSVRQTSTQLYGALQDDLEASALRLPETDQARTVLLKANAAYRRERGVSDLSRLLKRGITIGDDKVPRFAPGRVLTPLDKLLSTPVEELTRAEKLFIRSFEPEDWVAIRRSVEGLSPGGKIPPHPGEPPVPVPPHAWRGTAREGILPRTTPQQVRKIPATPPEGTPPAAAVPTLPTREAGALRNILRGVGLTEAVLTGGVGPVSKLTLGVEAVDKLAQALAQMMISPTLRPYVRSVMEPASGRISLPAMVMLAGGRAALRAEKKSAR